MWPADINWQMTVLFLLALALLGWLMKLIARRLQAGPPTPQTAMSLVLVSPNSLARSQPAAGVQPVVLRVLVLGGALLLAYWTYWQLINAFHIRGFLLGYLAAPFLFLASKFLVALVTLILLPGGRLLPTLHNRPWAARSTADFWGHRWNLWFNDWFRYVIVAPLRRQPLTALLLVFAISGLMHEWVLNLPLYFLTRRILFGTMMIYFLLQAVGILWERYCLRGHPHLMKISMWLVVFLPLPLVLNEAFLRAFHLWPSNDTV